jgi:hypothetical protein
MFLILCALRNTFGPLFFIVFEESFLIIRNKKNNLQRRSPWLSEKTGERILEGGGVGGGGWNRAKH